MSTACSPSLATLRIAASQATLGISTAPIHEHLRTLALETGSHGALLDFGSGSGEMLRELNALGQFGSLAGADLMHRPSGLAGAIEWTACDLNDRLPMPEQSYDVVLSSEVIEHLENPRAVVREWYRLLKPGGHLIFSTPNCESWRAILSLIVQGHYAAFNDRSYPAHITALVCKDLERILTEAGFREIKFSFVKCGCIPKMHGVTWQQISGGILRGRRFSDNVAVSARRPFLNGNQ